MDASDVAAFRQRYHFAIVERLAIKNAFAVPLLFLGKSLEESQNDLKDWLDQQSNTADQAYGAYFGDPALAALYAEEVKEVTEDMKTIVDKIAQRIKRREGKVTDQRKPKLTDAERHKRFVNMAREVEASPDPKDFEKAFKKVVLSKTEKSKKVDH